MPLVFGFSTGPFIVDIVDSPAPSPFATSPPKRNFSDALESPICPLGSTATKQVRTFEMGREMSPATLNEAAGERPREGGEVDSSFCSNFARKEATPLGETADMTEASSTVSNCNAHESGCGVR